MQNIQYFYIFHGKNDYANAPQCYVMFSLPVLLVSRKHRCILRKCLRSFKVIAVPEYFFFRGQLSGHSAVDGGTLSYAPIHIGMFTHPAGDKGSAVFELKFLWPMMANFSPNGFVHFLTNYSTFQLSELQTLLFSIILKQETALLHAMCSAQ